jgi:hypothetical protein
VGKDPSSPKFRQRQRGGVAYRGRGHRNTNLSLVYSVKTNRDWIVNNDRRLVHWLTFLQSDPSVKWFDLDPSRDGEASVARANVDCVEVHRVDGGKEWHRVVVGGSRDITDIEAAAKSQAAPSWEVFGNAAEKPSAEVLISPAIKTLRKPGTMFRNVRFPLRSSRKEHSSLNLSDSPAMGAPSTLLPRFALVRIATLRMPDFSIHYCAE